jgi:hypothetical protein
MEKNKMNIKEKIAFLTELRLASGDIIMLRDDETMDSIMEIYLLTAKSVAKELNKKKKG